MTYKGRFDKEVDLKSIFMISDPVIHWDRYENNQYDPLLMILIYATDHKDPYMITINLGLLGTKLKCEQIKVSDIWLDALGDYYKLVDKWRRVKNNAQ